jgi:hypothetical protein
MSPPTNLSTVILADTRIWLKLARLGWAGPPPPSLLYYVANGAGISITLLWLSLAFLSFLLALPDNLIFAR